MVTIHTEHDVNYTIEVGYNIIFLDKLFGATIFCGLKIWPDSKTCEWVVERQWIDENGDSSWEEVTRIDGQESIYFHDNCSD